MFYLNVHIEYGRGYSVRISWRIVLNLVYIHAQTSRIQTEFKTLQSFKASDSLENLP
jgi:hypothetical protein